MKKTTKGSLAAVGAAALLLGGGTSLAYWTASGDAPVASITAGELKLTDGTCDADWVYASGANAGNPVTLWVPGDVVTKSCEFTVTATGDDLMATLVSPSTVALTDASKAAADTESATVAVSYLLDNAAIVDADTGLSGTQITEAAGTRTLKATFNVTFPFGDTTTVNANDTQSWEAAFEALTVTLTQVNPN